MDKEYMKLLSEVEQSSEFLTQNLPPLWWGMYQNCLKTGFTEEHAIAKDLKLNHVPTLDVSHHFPEMPIPELITYANGKSVLSNEIRESIVFKQRGNYSTASFKIVSNEYLLKHGI
ncbi:MAG: hypothetical protein LBK82_05195 [Planctomycetaceae bacterium]|jgi:hypothetical protein|nr:hypothetical protein [Planctomycetaceae bacterium]